MDGVVVLNAMNAMLPASEMPAHPSSPTLQSEHMAAMDLAPPQNATHVAAASGDWSSPSTWQGAAFLMRAVGSLFLKGWFSRWMAN